MENENYMKLDDIKDRLLRLDAYLLFGENIKFKCYIVGGGASK